MKKGDYFIIDYKNSHKYTIPKNEICYIINCLFLPQFIDNSLAQCRNFNGLISNYLIRFNQNILKYNPTNYIYHDDDGTIFALVNKLFNEYTNKEKGYFELMRCTLIEIIIRTMRKIIDLGTLPSLDSSSDYIIKYIEKNYSQKISLSKISMELNYTLPYLSSKFKSDTGSTFNEYLQKTRIEQSCILLSNTNKKIPEIAWLVGYEDVKYFRKLFKKYMNTSVSEFRKKSQYGSL